VDHKVTIAWHHKLKRDREGGFMLNFRGKSKEMQTKKVVKPASKNGLDGTIRAYMDAPIKDQRFCPGSNWGGGGGVWEKQGSVAEGSRCAKRVHRNSSAHKKPTKGWGGMGFE